MIREGEYLLKCYHPILSGLGQDSYGGIIYQIRVYNLRDIYIFLEFAKLFTLLFINSGL